MRGRIVIGSCTVLIAIATWALMPGPSEPLLIGPDADPAFDASGGGELTSGDVPVPRSRQLSADGGAGSAPLVRARDVVSRLGAELDRVRQGLPEHRAWLECVEAEGAESARCMDLDTAAWNIALELRLFGELEVGAFGLAELIDSMGREQAREELVRTVVGDVREAERIATIAALDRVDVDRLGVPDELMDNLEQRGTAEQALTLRLYDGVGPAGPAEACVVRLASGSPDRRVRRHAIRALGHSENAEALRAVIGRIETDLENPVLATTLAATIGRCGRACAPVVSELEMSPHAAARAVAAQARLLLASQMD